MSSKQVRAYEHGLLNLEHRGERYVPLNIITNKTELTNNATHTLPSDVSEIDQQAGQNLTRNNVCIQNQLNETYCYLFGKHPASFAVPSTVVEQTGTSCIKMLDLILDF